MFLNHVPSYLAANRDVCGSIPDSTVFVLLLPGGLIFRIPLYWGEGGFWERGLLKGGVIRRNAVAAPSFLFSRSASHRHTTTATLHHPLAAACRYLLTFYLPQLLSISCLSHGNCCTEKSFARRLRSYMDVIIIEF